MVSFIATSKHGQSEHYTVLEDLYEYFSDTGLVDAGLLPGSFDTAQTADAEGWNNKKNVSVVGADLAGTLPSIFGHLREEVVTLNNFVHVDADFSDYVANSEGIATSVELTIQNTKRGNIVLGEGEDELNISSVSNGAHWSNKFRIDAGKGADTINLNKGDDEVEGFKFKKLINDGSATTFYIDLGDDQDADVITTELESDMFLTNFNGAYDWLRVDVNGEGSVEIDGTTATVFDDDKELFKVTVDTSISADHFEFI